MDNIFINEVFDSSIKDFLKLQKQSDEILENSFCISVLKMLATIYGEVDIINPYIIRNEKSFKNNIMKFGYSEESYEVFKDNFLKYFQIEFKNNNLNPKKDNPYFVKVQKDLIDMFITKKINYQVSEEEQKTFFSLLYTNKTTNPLKVSYNFLTAKDVNEVEEYFMEQLEKCEEALNPIKKSDILNIEAYEILNYSLTDIANMDSESVDKINENIYNFFDIDEEAENKNDLLNTAIENYKKYNSRLTSGNGYVDILLVMGIIVTGILILSVATFIIF